MIQTYIYPLVRLSCALPINVSLTYTQIKDSTRQTGTLRSAKETVKLPFAHLVQLNPEVDKGNERFKV